MNTIKPITYYNQERSDMFDFIPKNVKRVLEIGCGEGNFSKRIKMVYNAEVWGIEIEKSAAEVAKSELDQVFVGDFNEVSTKLPNNYFDCIIMNDVLEHFPDHLKVLDSLKKLLKVDGVVVLSIPNVRYIKNIYELLVEKDWRYRSAGILDETHLRFFTMKSIRRDVMSTGYDLIKIKGINPLTTIKIKFLYYVMFILSLGSLGTDTKYTQFACVIKKKK